MNIKSFTLGFTAVDSMLGGISAVKRSVVHATKATARGAQVSAQATKSSAINASEAVTSFFAGMRHASRVRSGKCRLLSGEE